MNQQIKLEKLFLPQNYEYANVNSLKTKNPRALMAKHL